MRIRSIRKWNTVLLITLIVWGIGFAGLAAYAGQHTFPTGFVWGEWRVAGVREADFRDELQRRLEALLQSRVRFVLPEGAAAGTAATAASYGAAAGTAATAATAGSYGAAAGSYGAAAGTAATAGTFSLAELGLNVDVSRLEAAAAQLFRGSKLQRARARWSMRDARVPLELHADRTAALRAVGSLWPQLLQARPQEARRVITADDRVGYVPGKSAAQVNADALVLELGTTAERIFRGLIAAPAESIGGQRSAVLRLMALPTTTPTEPTVITLPLETIAPTVTVDTLRAEGIDRKIIEFSTFFPISGEGRKHNIRSTAQTIHDTILKPEEEFDYSQIIRATQQQFGFKEAPVILNGKLVPGIGGGICQVSTTLYNAVLRAGLQITERRNHSLPISYAPLGQDATYADGWINFKFRNNTGSYLQIRTDVTDTGITVKLFGRMSEALSYEIVSNTIETITPPVKVVVNPTLAAGQETLLQEGKPGYVVETYRIRRQNGTVETKELISKDTYQPQPTLVARNRSNETQPSKPNPNPKEKRNMLEDGISGPTFHSITGAFRQ